MKYIRLGNTDLTVSKIGLGMMTYGDPNWRKWVLSENDSFPIIRKAVDLGVNFFDTADVYSLGASEELTGRLLKQFLRREEMVIATKVYFFMTHDANDGCLSREHILKAVDGSLRRLGTDYIDLYQVHRFDYSTPIEETMSALNEVVKAGKVRFLGASSMYTHQFVKMQCIAQINNLSLFKTMQNHYNLIYREEEREMIPYCLQEGIGIIPWSPLARGFLVGNRSVNSGGATVRAKTDHLAGKLYYQANDFVVLQKLLTFANERDFKPAQVALAWLLHKKISSPIIGATKIWQLEEAVGALDINLSETDIKYLEESYLPHSIREHY